MATANSNGHAPIAAVDYYRMSSDQQEASIPAQKKAVEKYAAEHGYNIIRSYQDDGISGWKEEREGFQQLITDLERRDFQAVLCWDQNRFSRFPVLEANHYWYLLDRAGVHLSTCNQGRLDWTSIAGWITASIKQHGDAQHRFQLSVDVTRGKREAAERGDWQGAIPLGYVIQNKRLVPGDSHNVETVRRIFREYRDGHSLRGIAHRLNAEGIRSARGMWAPSSVQLLLRNPAYAGTFRYRGTETPDHHPAIIDQETILAVRRFLSERKTKTTPKPNGGGFLLTGILRCGKCGSSMSGSSRSGHVYYQCGGRRHKGGAFCDHNCCKQPELIEHVITAIEARFMNPKVVQRLRDDMRRKLSRETKKVTPDAIRKDLTAVEAKLAKAKKRLVECDTDMLPVVQESIRDMRGQCERLEAALAAAETPRNALIEAADIKIDKAMSLFGSLRETLRKADTVRLREQLREGIGKIEVWSDLRTRGERRLFDLTRGVIHIRADNLFSYSDTA